MEKFLNQKDAIQPPDTLDGMYESLKDVMRAHIEIKLEHNFSISLPLPSDALSGKTQKV